MGSGATESESRSRQKKRSLEGRRRAAQLRWREAWPGKTPGGDIAEFRYERVTGDERDRLAFPSVKKLGWRAPRRQECGEQDVGVEDEAYHDRLARSR